MRLAIRYGLIAVGAICFHKTPFIPYMIGAISIFVAGAMLGVETGLP